MRKTVKKSIRGFSLTTKREKYLMIITSSVLIIYVILSNNANSGQIIRVLSWLFLKLIWIDLTSMNASFKKPLKVLINIFISAQSMLKSTPLLLTSTY